MNEAKLALKDKFSQFIGSHPIAGSEKHGTSAAKKDLFQDKNIVLTPNNKNHFRANYKTYKILGVFGWCSYKYGSR